MHRLRQTVQFVLISMVLLVTLPACSSSGAAHTGLEMANMNDMPAEVQQAAVSVQQAYQFAAANPDLMKQVACYCGCGDIGHTSNYDCYVTESDGTVVITYDDHAIGCSICVDITQDVMRLQTQGKSSQEIRTYVDSTYSKYGPSNMP